MDTIEKAIQKLETFDSGNLALDKASPIIDDEFAMPDPGSLERDFAVVQADRKKSSVKKRSGRSLELDLEAIRRAGMLVPDAKRSRIKEEYRYIKRPLLMNVAGKGAAVVPHANLIMISSAKPGEGKTFNAINLALSIATERDRTVLLVDSDVLKPAMSRFFKLNSGPGLVDYLVEDDLDLADLMVETNIPSLKILPAGNTHHLSTELLASDNMRQLAQELSERYSDRVVIFDSPPLLAATEPSVLASLMGQILLVVESDRTSQAAVKEALELLDLESKIVGFVLNKSRNTLWGDYYGYGYGYGYGKGYGYGYGYGHDAE